MRDAPLCILLGPAVARARTASGTLGRRRAATGALLLRRRCLSSTVAVPRPHVCCRMLSAPGRHIAGHAGVEVLEEVALLLPSRRSKDRLCCLLAEADAMAAEGPAELGRRLQHAALHAAECELVAQLLLHDLPAAHGRSRNGLVDIHDLRPPAAADARPR